jgi:hypothetical protein
MVDNVIILTFGNGANPGPTAAAVDETATVSWAIGGSSNGNTASEVIKDASVITDASVGTAVIVGGTACISVQKSTASGMILSSDPVSARVLWCLAVLQDQVLKEGTKLGKIGCTTQNFTRTDFVHKMLAHTNIRVSPTPILDIQRQTQHERNSPVDDNIISSSFHIVYLLSHFNYYSMDDGV